MQRLNRPGLTAAAATVGAVLAPMAAVLAPMAAVLMPMAPALAAEITPTGQIFSDYTVNLGDAIGGATPLKNSFNVTRARIGLIAKLDENVWGKVLSEVSPNATGRLDMWLKHGFVDLSLFGMGRVRGGQFDTLWSIPVEEDWLPFRFAGQMFSNREGLFPIQDRGVMWYGGDPVELAVAVFNGEGDTGAESVLTPSSFTKSYEARVRARLMEGAEIAVDARVADAPPGNPKSNTLIGGLNVRTGPAVVGVQGAYNMVTDNKGLQTNGMGGSAHMYLPKVAMNHTPMLRADFYDADPSNATSNAHLRLIAGLGYEWAKGADTMLTYEYTSFLKTTAVAPDHLLAVRGGLKF